MVLHFGVITIMPTMMKALECGITGRAITAGLVNVPHWNPRDWAAPPHCAVDDKPYGGGPGMVMLYSPLHQAITHAKSEMPATTRTIYLSPQGKQVRQADLNQVIAAHQSLLFVAGRYEGIDERVLETDIDEEWSVGDFVLSGGELAAMVFIDALIRLIPGSLGCSESARNDTFMTGFLDHPHYTRPASIDGMAVPDVLLGGDHSAILRWRRKEALGKTWLKRPDLFQNNLLDATDKQLLDEFKTEHGLTEQQESLNEE
ncbi:MAG: tRNA (guanosine(37)-N1)-methyltransferase TrmD [Legionella sp. 21-45-4]|nr:MAG: tRNA (guanosine(37)-N1)-methyltransferase TrmD [Legionella sp. 21-45-4]